MSDGKIIVRMYASDDPRTRRETFNKSWDRIFREAKKKEALGLMKRTSPPTESVTGE